MELHRYRSRHFLIVNDRITLAIGYIITYSRLSIAAVRYDISKVSILYVNMLVS